MELDQRTSTPAERFRATLDLIEVGIGLMRQNLVRKHPGADDATIERRLREWLWRQPAEAPRDPALRLVTPPRL